MTNMQSQMTNCRRNPKHGNKLITVVTMILNHNIHVLKAFQKLRHFNAIMVFIKDKEK